MKKLVSFLLVFVLFFLFSGSVKADTVLFKDSFDNGASNWQADTNWQVMNGQFGAVVPFSPGATNAVPVDSVWNQNWTNYAFDVDMNALQGTDRNVIVKYKDDLNFYEVHHTGGFIYFDKFVDGSLYNIATGYYFPIFNGTTHHFRVENHNNTHFKILIDGNQIYDVDDSGPTFPETKIGLRVQSLAAFPTEVWFDNVVVTDITPVPLTIDKIIADLNDAWSKNLITNKVVYETIKASLLAARGMLENNKVKMVKLALQVSLGLLKFNTPKYIDSQTSTNLQDEITSFMASL